MPCWRCLLAAGAGRGLPRGAAGRAEYAIHHDDHGEVGRHVITFACAGEELIVETMIEGEVTVLMVPVFQRAARYREVWRGDRLIAFDSRSRTTARSTRSSARADGEQT